MWILRFEGGTLTLRDSGFAETSQPLPEAAAFFLKFDSRSNCYRGRASDYAMLEIILKRSGVVFQDEVKSFEQLPLKLSGELIPREHQRRALTAWKRNRCRGIAALPTGSGKSFLAVMAMAELQLPTLVVAPTIDLVQQWASLLERFFARKVGMLGGGESCIEFLTVSTYDSAVLQMEFIGNRFGLLIFDECHHLPGPVNQMAAAMCIAPFRLGLTATPEMPPDRMQLMSALVGPVVCQVHIDELSGNVLSPYETLQIPLTLDAEERRQYEENRAIYTNALRRWRIQLAEASGWAKFLGMCARSPEGKCVFDAFLRQRKIARGGRAKFDAVSRLLLQHKGERMIIFTADNDTAYDLGRRFFLPVLTHHTKLGERKAMLDSFRSGRWPVLVTSKVLNEGIDVPEANVAVILSGSGSVREHVQRLGRVLRAAPGKKAVLYELLNQDTAEVYVGRRRREHRAYRRSRGVKRGEL